MSNDSNNHNRSKSRSRSREKPKKQQIFQRISLEMDKESLKKSNDHDFKL
jgi:hypothetical protein